MCMYAVSLQARVATLSRVDAPCFVSLCFLYTTVPLVEREFSSSQRGSTRGSEKGMNGCARRGQSATTTTYVPHARLKMWEKEEKTKKEESERGKWEGPIDELRCLLHMSYYYIYYIVE
jgi:hypothetical protein